MFLFKQQAFIVDDSIIEKFTNIYIDEYLLDDKITPRSSLRKLLINLTLYQIEKSINDNIIVFIDDIDNSFDELELFNIIKTLENNFNAKFVVSSSRNIYPYIVNKKLTSVPACCLYVPKHGLRTAPRACILNLSAAVCQCGSTVH